jgi:hypothetical protein
VKNDRAVKFINYTPRRYEEDNTPVSIIKTLPNWYKDFPKYIDEKIQEETNPINISTVKNCLPFFDAMTAGYSFVTPCDIEFYEEDGIPKSRVLDKRFEDFIGERGPMPHFHNPEGYYDHHFHWYPAWGVKLPDGYSGLYVSPLNRYELPFLTTSGIMDNDKVTVRGFIPFFLKIGFSGIIKKGTPFMQIIPFKREDWRSETELLTEEQVRQENLIGMKKYREPKANGYRDTEWERKSYK